MNRRKVLLGSGVVLTSTLAGCTGNETGNGENSGNGNSTNPSNSGNNESDTEEPTDGGNGNTDNESAGEPEFEVESLDMPEEVEVGEEWSWSITVANTGDADGTFETAVYVKTADTDFTEVGTIELEIPAGGTATYESDTGTLRYITRATYRFEALDLEQEIQAVSRSLTFGESYRTPQDIVVTAHSIDLRDVYEYENYDGETATEEASSGSQWAFLEFEAANESGSSEFVPLEGDVSLIAGDTQYDSQYISKEDGKYEGGEVQPGITREGWIAYEIPSDLRVGDLEVAYSGSNFEGEWSVRWRSE